MQTFDEAQNYAGVSSHGDRCGATLLIPRGLHLSQQTSPLLFTPRNIPCMHPSLKVGSYFAHHILAGDGRGR